MVKHVSDTCFTNESTDSVDFQNYNDAGFHIFSLYLRMT